MFEFKVVIPPCTGVGWREDILRLLILEYFYCSLFNYKSVIVPITEYACPAWHTSLTKHDTDTLENIQKRAMSVIFPGLKYYDALKTSKLPTLSTRRDLLCKAFFIQMSNPEHKLNYLLEKRHEHPYELRHNQKFKIEIPHTERYKNSFIMHSLVNYQ